MRIWYHSQLMTYENLRRGIPFKSKYAKFVPEAIALRKSTDDTWDEIATMLSKKHGVEIPKSSLHRAVVVRLSALEKRKKLPDLQLRTDAPTEVPSSPPLQQEKQHSKTPISEDFDDLSDFGDDNPKIKINRRKK